MARGQHPGLGADAPGPAAAECNKQSWDRPCTRGEQAPPGAGAGPGPLTPPVPLRAISQAPHTVSPSAQNRGTQGTRPQSSKDPPCCPSGPRGPKPIPRVSLGGHTATSVLRDPSGGLLRGHRGANERGSIGTCLAGAKVLFLAPGTPSHLIPLTARGGRDSRAHFPGGDSG